MRPPTTALALAISCIAPQATWAQTHAQTHPLPLAASRETTLRGSIVDVLGVPLPATEIRAADANGHELARAVADGDGLFLFPHLPRDTRLVLTANVRDHVPLRTELAADTAGARIQLVVEEGLPFRGRIVAQDGTPIAGASVVASRTPLARGPTLSDFRDELTTDANGEYTLPQAPLPAMTISAWAPGYWFAQRIFYPAQDAPNVLALDPGPPAPREVVLEGLPAGITATLQIVPAREERDAGITVDMLPAALRGAVCREPGATLWALPFRHGIRLTAPGLECRPAVHVCRERALEPLHFVLTPTNDQAQPPAPSTAMDVQVVDGDGKPLADERLRCRTLDGELLGEGRSDADGRIRFPAAITAGLPCSLALIPGRHLIGAPEAQLGRDGLVALETQAGSPLRIVAVPTNRIRGTAQSGEIPLAHARVWVRQDSKVELTIPTDASGRFDVGGLPDGRYEVWFADQGVRWAAGIELGSGEDRDLGVLRTPPTGALEGTVVDADGKPVPGAVLHWIVRPSHGSSPSTSGALQSHYGKADRRGAFRLPIVAAGECELRVVGLRIAPLARGAVTRTDLAAGQTRQVTVRQGP